MFANKINLNLIILFLFILYNNTISYCVERPDVVTTIIHGSQSSTSLVVIGITLTTLTFGYAAYYLYNKYLKNIPPKPPLDNNENNVRSILSVSDNSSESAESVTEIINNNPVISGNSVNFADEPVLAPSIFDILSLGVSQLTHISHNMIDNQRLYTQLISSESIVKSTSDLDLILILQSIQAQNIETLRLLNDVNQLYLLYLSNF